MNVERGEDFEACFDSGLSGQVGTVALMLIDNDGGTTWPADTTDIVESPAASGIYCANRTAPLVLGQYTLVWSVDGTYDPATVGIEDLFVVSVGASLSPIVPPADQAGPTGGPCAAWTTSELAAECCGNSGVGSDTALLDDSVIAASEALYELSARQFPGACIERTMRPCDPGQGCGVQTLPSGYVIRWTENCWCGSSGPSCSCQPLSQVYLPNYPVAEVLEVLIDGVVVDPAEYRLDGWQRLTRLADADGRAQSWPACQRLDKAETEEGTFVVRYLAGRNPPVLGQKAAGELACQIYLSCSQGQDNSECVLPSGVTRVTRQGITFDLTKFKWAFAKADGWKTGLSLVDLFLNSYNPRGLRRAPLIWSPDAMPVAQEVGTAAGS